MQGRAVLAIVIACGLGSVARADDPAPGAGSGSGSGAKQENELPPDLAPKPVTDDQPPSPPPNPTPPAPTSDPNDPKVKAEARKLIDGGDTFLKKGDALDRRGHHDQAVEQYQRALAAYQKAYELVGNPQVYYAIAGAEEKLGRWLEAANHYKMLLAQATDMKPALKDAATQRLEAAKQNLGQVTLTVNPDGTHVAVDGKDVGTTPLADPILLDPGEYTLSFTADGYTPMEQKIKVEAGSESERTFTLQRLPVVVEKPKPPPAPPPPPPTVSKLPLYVGAGATGAFTVTAVVTGIVAIKKHSTFVNSADPAARAAARTSGKHFALACDLTMIGALASAGFTAYWYVKQYKPRLRELEQAPPGGPAPDGDEPAALEPRFWVAPAVDGDGGGLVIGGSF